MNTLKTTYQYEGGEVQSKEVDLELLKEYSLNEIRLIFIMNFMMPIEPISKHINEGQLYSDYNTEQIEMRQVCKLIHESDKTIKLEHEQVISLFPSKNTFYDTVKKLIDKNIIKRLGRNRYALPKSIFKLSNNGGTSVNIFKEFNNPKFQFEDLYDGVVEHDDDRFFDGTFDGYLGYSDGGPHDDDYYCNPQFKVIP